MINLCENQIHLENKYELFVIQKHKQHQLSNHYRLNKDILNHLILVYFILKNSLFSLLKPDLKLNQLHYKLRGKILNFSLKK